MMDDLVKSAEAKLTVEEFHAVMQYGIDSDPSYPYLIANLVLAAETDVNPHVRLFAMDMIDEAGK